MDKVVVVGGGVAGLTAAEELRRQGYAGSVTMVGEERDLPYDRPPLSKQVLMGEWEPDRVMLRPQIDLDGLRADWRLGATATGLDVASGEVDLSDGGTLPYDGLVIATGVRPRRLPGPPLRGLHVLRTLRDALALRDELGVGSRVVVIGAGFLGAEVAAVARRLGCAVSMVDPLPAPLVRQLGPELGQACAALHLTHGVDLRCGVGVAEVADDRQGAVRSVVLDDGTELAADVVLMAIGSTPVTGWLEGSGLAIDDGVVCDEACAAGPGIVAAGDVARWQHPVHGSIRVEHRMNATEQAMAAARTLLGDRAGFAPVPYFWTDQYEVKIQAYGIVGGAAEMRIVAGDPEQGRFGALYEGAGRVVGAITWNMPAAARLLRGYVAASMPWSEAAAGAAALA